MIASRNLDCGSPIGLGLCTRTSACGRARCAARCGWGQRLETPAWAPLAQRIHAALATWLTCWPSPSFAFSDLLLIALVFNFASFFHCTKLYLPSHFLRDSFRVDCVLLDLFKRTVSPSMWDVKWLLLVSTHYQRVKVSRKRDLRMKPRSK